MISPCDCQNVWLLCHRWDVIEMYLSCYCITAICMMHLSYSHPISSTNADADYADTERWYPLPLDMIVMRERDLPFLLLFFRPSASRGERTTASTSVNPVRRVGFSRYMSTFASTRCQGSIIHSIRLQSPSLWPGGLMIQSYMGFSPTMRNNRCRALYT